MTNFPGTICQRCGKASTTGYFCQRCIEWLWPQAAVGDGRHWIVSKVTIRRTADLACGAAGAPYEKGGITIPFGSSCWLLSQAGALKEVIAGKNTDPNSSLFGVLLWCGHFPNQLSVTRAIVRVANVALREDRVLVSNSPALVIDHQALHEFDMTPEHAAMLLTKDARLTPTQMDGLDRFEAARRPALPQNIELPPAFDSRGPRYFSKAEHNVFMALKEEFPRWRSIINDHLREPQEVGHYREWALGNYPDELRAFRQRTVTLMWRLVAKREPPTLPVGVIPSERSDHQLTAPSS